MAAASLGFVFLRHARRRTVVPAIVVALGSLAFAASPLLQVTLGTVDDVISEQEATRRWSLLSPGQRHALGASDDDRRRAFVTMLREEMLLAVEATRSGLPKRFAVSEARRRVLARAVIDKATREAGPASAIADDDVTAYYDAHRSTFETVERVQLWRILCKSEAEAADVLKTAKAKGSVQDWMSLAREHSVDEATKFRGGNLGFVDAKGVSDDAPVSVDVEVVDAVRGLADGAVVDHPVAERGYFAVIWRRSTLPAVHRSLDEVASSIRGTLWRERLAKVEDEAAKTIVAARASHVDLDALTVIDEGLVKRYDTRKNAGN
jgi:hypothetical protein